MRVVLAAGSEREGEGEDDEHDGDDAAGEAPRALGGGDKVDARHEEADAAHEQPGKRPRARPRRRALRRLVDAVGAPCRRDGAARRLSVSLGVSGLARHCLLPTGVALRRSA